MNIHAGKGHKVVYTGADEAQAKYGGFGDPRGVFEIGETYTIRSIDIRSWSTGVVFDEKPGQYNSVCFDDYVEPVKKTPEEWADEQHILILDPDGWRKGNMFNDGEPKNFREPITEIEFIGRLSESTIMSRPEAQECGDDEVDIDELLKENEEYKEEIENFKIIIDNFTGLLTSMSKSKQTCMMCNSMERDVCLDEKDKLRNKIAYLEFGDRHSKKIIKEMTKLLNTHVAGWSSAIDDTGVHVD